MFFSASAEMTVQWFGLEEGSSLFVLVDSQLLADLGYGV